MTKYKAEIVPLNAAKIGSSAHGTATFEVTADQLTIQIEMFDTPANTEHWEHFHGFPDGRQQLLLKPTTLTKMVLSI